MKKVILWLEENGPYIVAGILVIAIVGGLAWGLQAGLFLVIAGNDDPSFRQMVSETPVVIGVDCGIAGIIWGWNRARRWAHETPKPKKVAPLDPDLEAARREVEEIAPSESDE